MKEIVASLLTLLIFLLCSIFCNIITDTITAYCVGGLIGVCCLFIYVIITDESQTTEVY